MKDLATVVCELMKERVWTAQLQRDLTSRNQKINSLKAELARKDRLIHELSLKCGCYKPDPQTAESELITAHDRIRELEKETAAKDERIKELEQSGYRQAHPFRRRKKKPKSRHKKPGRRKGRGDFKQREEPAKADKTETVPLVKCPQCSCRDLPDRKELVNWQIDIPPIKPEVTRFNTQGCLCPQCDTWVQSRHPLQLSTAMGAANITLGPRAIAAAADMHERHGMSYEKIADVFSELLNFTVTASCLCKSLDRLLDKAEPVYAELIGRIRQCSVVHADETGWRIGDLNAWLWVFTNSRICIYTIRKGEGARGHKAVLEVLGHTFHGTLVSDCFVAYDKDCFDGWLKQKCYSHLLKAFSELSESKKAEAVAFAIDVCSFLTETMQLKKQRQELSQLTYEEKRKAAETKLDALLDRYAGVKDEDSARLLNRLVKHRRHLLTFLYHEEVDPTNNIAERDVRPAVISRKTQGCNKTDNGALKHSVLASVIVTARKQGMSVIDTLESIQQFSHPPGEIWGESLNFT